MLTGSAPSRQPAPSLRLGPAAAELYGDLRLAPMLDRLLDQSRRLLGVMAGGVSLVDSMQDRYTKAAERGASCRLGQTFPMDEGVTGQVTAGRRPVVLRSYDQVRRGHLPQDHPARSGAVAAVPIWWLGRVIGVNVAFAGCDRRFTAREVDELELLSQVVAAGIVACGGAEPSLAHLIRRQATGVQDLGALVVTEAGSARATSPEVARTALQLVARARAEAGRRTPAGPVRVAVIHHADGVRLLVHESGTAAEPCPTSTLVGWQDLVASSGGLVSVQGVPGWGVLVRAELPHRGPSVHASGLTPREQDVLVLLAEGLTDRQVADSLRLSHKTVEKHVGAVLRKSGTTSRTGAVMRAVQLGWLSLAQPDVPV